MKNIPPKRLYYEVEKEELMYSHKLVLAFFISFSLFLFLNKNENRQSVLITIQKDEPLSIVSNRLQKENVIKSKRLFLIYTKLKRLDTSIQPGTFSLHKNQRYRDILTTITTSSKAIDTIKVVIPEGYTVEEIANRLNDLNIVKRDEFLQAVNNQSLLPKEYKDFFPKEKQLKYFFEGYLYPDTYFFQQNMIGEEVVEAFLNRFIQVIQSINKPDELTHLEWVILASMIEKEAAVTAEQKRISGVFYNRIREGWKLESCATVQYGLNERKEQLLLKDLQVESKYNTYLFKGLPIGPISNPGKQSLEAASQPESHSYFFFVTKEDGTNTHYFSKTFEEHRKYTDKNGNE